ncbi:MAG: alpha-ketoacid dehydrogenase subunit beta [Candidatus Eremiobacter antarcticus]|nr:alpha-ketoacid dehydrogenase subunit beta [Candidatus Eremiobacteraeota bacterium]MBC5808030.1 alpha-ketoacid dehydrogenase subunit beta [Candidatus Eremiobacteraeota bacterium]PZR63438.1 MAG: alpha-ketoacid dehydrogenase subunit beta [Candidatus Eremiobacter sp. RRmetagenome_bin22]
MATAEVTKTQTQSTMVQALRSALLEEMERDENVVLLGEDIGPRGGVFLITEGLIDRFGKDRVIDTPLAEAGIIGAAVGMACYGLRPVAEIQFIDFIFPGFDLLVSEAAKMRYRSAGQFACPMVVRSPYGGGVRGGGYHSQSPEAYFVATPGLKVVAPSNPYDAKGLLIASIRDNDPVVFMEPKKIYRAVKNEVPAGTYEIPIGKAAITREGKHVSVITYGAMVHVALEAAEIMQKERVEVEILDLRTLQPYDSEAILETVGKTGHVVVLQEAPRIGGFAGEIAAFIAEEAIGYLEGPIVRVAGWDTPFPYALEKAYMPNAQRVCRAIKKSINF